MLGKRLWEVIGLTTIWEARSGKKKSRKISKIKKILRSGGEVLFEALFETTSEYEAFREEERVILRFGRLDSKTGILTNSTNGGEGPSGNVASEESRAKMSAWQVGRKQPCNVERFSKTVTAFLDDGSVFKVFQSSKDACLELGLYDKAVIHCLRGTLRHATGTDGTGYRFMRGEVSVPMEPLGKAYAMPTYHSIEVSLFLDDGSYSGTYSSALRAAQHLGVNGCSVRRALKKNSRIRSKSGGGPYRVREGNSTSPIEPWVSSRAHWSAKEVIQLTPDGVEVGRYLSTAVASEATGVHLSSISKCAAGENRTGGGFLWRYSEPAA